MASPPTGSGREDPALTAPRVPTTDAERYRALVEQAVDGIFVTNDEGVYLEVNASGARLLGRTRDEIVGHSVNDFLDDASRVQLADDWVILRRGDAVTRERTFRRGDGSTFPGEVTAKRLSDGTYQGILRDISVRRKAEETLRRNEEHLRHLTAASLEGICIQQNGVIVETNAQFAAMLGYGYDELVGCEVLSLMAPESMALMTEVVRGRLDGIFEQVLLRKDGSRIVVESQAKNVRWDDRPLRIVAVRDISERKRTELALRTSEEKFSKIFRVSPISIILSDIAIGRIIDVNDAFLRTYVCKREAVVGRTTLELGLWQDPAERAHLISVVAREGTAHNFRIRGRTVPGTPITVLVNCELLEFSGQTCILTMVQDITEQERAEEALRESEDKFSRAFRSGPSALAISEFETGRYIEVNEGFTRLYGYTREEAVGRTSVELGIMRSTAERAELMRNFTSGGTIRELELQTVNRRGETIHYLLNAEVMMLRGRRCIVLAAQDITERVRAEAERAGRAVAEMRAHEEFTRRLLDAQEAE
ncbi:MAG TPA: PAS domain S-box protein, partial [Opitutaceae bacterium]|nr:PAS domain S-box protein [Opitutaceae bacterium]